MVGIAVTIDARSVERMLRRLGRSLDRRRLLTAIGIKVLGWVNQNFREGGSERRWKPLSPNTVAGRRGGGGGAQPLRDTGRLAQSFSYAVRGTHVDVGTSDRRAPWHHFGTRPREIKPKTAKALRFMSAGGVVFTKSVQHPGLPSRRLLPSDREANSIVRRTITREISRALGRRGRR